MSDIATKLTYLNTTKGKIKDSINLTGAGITNEPFRQYNTKLKDAYVDIINNGTDTLYSNFPKVSGSGTDLSLTPTYEAPMQTTLNGNTSQIQLSGKNLMVYPYYESSITRNNLSFTAQQDGGVLVNGKPTGLSYIQLERYIDIKPNTTYTLSGLQVEKNIIGQINEYNGTTPTQEYNARTNEFTFTTTSSTNKISIQIKRDYNNVSINNILVYPQLEEGSAATPYEQYCGGTPSPNPSYPQDVNVVSGDNDIVICGRNLLNYDNNTNLSHNYLNNSGGWSSNANVWHINQKIETYNIKTYSISFESMVGTAYIRLGQFKSDDTFISRTLITENTTITLDNQCSYIILSIEKNDNAYFSKLQLEIGNTIHSYIAYTLETTYPITLPANMELCKIGDYKDYFYKQDDKWYLHKEIGKVVFDGSEDENWADSKVSGYTTLRFRSNLGVSIVNFLGYCDKFTMRTGTVQDVENCYNTTAQVYLSINPNRLNGTTVSDFETWLSNNNVIDYYVLATPTNTEITDTTLINQLNAIKDATSYTGTTNISQTNNDLPFNLDVSALKKDQ